MDTSLSALSAQLGAVLAARNWRVATAESCTGGGIAAAITATAGSSNWFDRGFVTYSNASKIELLGVQSTTLATHGAVSTAVVSEMVHGALQRSPVQLAVAVSGIAGPDGGSADKPVGTVCIAWCQRDALAQVVTRHFSGDREAVRRQTVIAALEGLIDLARTQG
jgi:nicotinamide-nucleotide amidase